MSERRRGSGCLVAVVVLIALLAAIGIIGDRAVKSYAEDTVAQMVTEELGMDATPEVDIHGWPFLWQLWQREIDHLTVTTPQVTLSDEQREVRINDLDVQLRRITANDDLSQVTAAELDAAGYFSWEELSRLTGNGEVAAAGDGRIRIRYTMEIFGQEVDVEASGRPVLNVEAQRLEIEDPSLRVVGMDVPQAITEQLMKLKLGEIDLALPLGLRIDSLAVTDAGVAVTVHGDEVQLRG